MDTQLNSQLYNQQARLMQQQQQQQQSFSAQNQTQSQTYGGAKEVAVSSTNAGYVASKFEVMKHPGVLVTNTVLGLLAAIGITRFANYLVKPDMSKIGDSVSHSQALEQSPLYKFGVKMDAFFAKVPGFNKAIEGIGKLKDKITGAASKNDILSEVGKKVKDGSKVTWSMGKFYEDGKGAEAIDEFVEFLEKAPEDAFTKKETKEFIHSVLEDVKSEKLSRTQAGKKIIENGCLEGISAKHLDKVLHVESKGFGAVLDKVFGTAPNLNTALAKAKFFNNNTKKLGPISKMFNSLSLMMMEGVGGGVLGGKMAMIMSIMGLVSAFNAGSKAMIAKKEKEKQLQDPSLTEAQRKELKKGPWIGERISAFMEDFAGFTLAGYLMTFPIGVAMNKFMGLANIGRDGKKVQKAADHLGVHGDKHLFQRSVISYNDAIDYDKNARKVIDVLEGKKGYSLFGKFKKIFGISSDAEIKAGMVQDLKLKDLDPSASKADTIKAIKASLKDEKWFDDTRKMLKDTAKSGLTIGSIFKETEHNKGSFIKRLGRFMVHKPLELSAKLLGPDKFLIFKKKGPVSNFFRSGLNKAGGVGRIALVALVLTVPFRNAFMKVSHKLFGKPSFSQYDEVKGVYEENEKAEQTRLAAAQAPQQKIVLPSADQQPIMQPPVYQNQISSVNPYQNQIKEAVEKAVPDNSVRNLDTYTYIPKV